MKIQLLMEIEVKDTPVTWEHIEYTRKSVERLLNSEYGKNHTRINDKLAETVVLTDVDASKLMVEHTVAAEYDDIYENDGEDYVIELDDIELDEIVKEIYQLYDVDVGEYIEHEIRSSIRMRMDDKTYKLNEARGAKDGNKND